MLLFGSCSLTFPALLIQLQPHLLAENLLKMNISMPTVLGMLGYLTNRPQFVKASPGHHTGTKAHTPGDVAFPFSAVLPI